MATEKPAPTFAGAQAPRTDAELACSERLTCRHCELPLGPGSTADGFCCRGCAAVHGLLVEQGLDRYYQLRGDRAGLPATDADGSGVRDRKWLEPLEARVRDAGDGRAARLAVDVQGLHCAACVWLIQQLFDRRPGALRLVVNPALGRADLLVRPDFPLRAFVEDVESFGYLLGPPRKLGAARSDDLLLRVGICLALAGNSMLFAAAIYLGLREGMLYRTLHDLELALATVAVWVGGSVFFRSAWQGLRRGLLHLDVPIALGIALAYAGSVWSFFFAGGRATYLDTVTVFVALMLVGRWLQERVLERNRMQLLANDGVDGLWARRVRDGALELVRCRDLGEGDLLLVAPGDLVPVDAILEGAGARFSTDWIDGESQPRDHAPGDLVPAGAFLASDAAVRLRATTAFEDSPLVSLLRAPRDRDADGPRSGAWWQRVAGWYVVAVLGAAAAGFLGWGLATGDWVKAVEVTTAVLVVTCPCAFGIATPLAYELVQGGLRRRGLFIRTATFLDRARDVRRIVFDKTGTLTTGGLALEDPAALDALDDEARAAIHDLAARSTHPKSRAVVDALERAGRPLPALRLDVRATEHAGRGLEATLGGARWRLGAPGWAADDGVGAGADLVLGRDGATVLAATTTERLRPDAAVEVAALRDAGFALHVSSGDAGHRVASLGASLGLSPAQLLGEQTPAEKAAWIEAHDRGDTLFVGDGINDALAVDSASCSGTPAIDRPFMPARSDFYFVTPGLSPIRLSLRAASRLAQTVRRNLGFAVAYNVGAVGLAWAGVMAPWVAAVLMPLSSVVIIAATSRALGPGSALWKS